MISFQQNKLLAIIILFISLFRVAFAAEVCDENWEREVEKKCDQGGMQDLIRCFGDASTASQEEDQRLYELLRNDLVDPALFIAAEARWKNYRDAECTYQSSGYACDTGIAGMCSLSSGICRTRLTCQRVRELRRHLDSICNGCPERKSQN